MGYGSQPRPVSATFFDTESSTSIAYNLQEITRHRDYFEIKKDLIISSSVTYSFGEYDEGLVYFDLTGSTEQVFNFNFTFSNTPIVALSMNEDVVNPFGITFSTTGAYIGISAPYSGSVRYRAINATSYPAYVSSSFTGTLFLASAATKTTTDNAQGFDKIYPALPSNPNELYETAWDSAFNSSNIYLSNSIFTNSYVSSSFSATYDGLVHFISIIGPPSSGSGEFMYTFSLTFGS